MFTGALRGGAVAGGAAALGRGFRDTKLLHAAARPNSAPMSNWEAVKGTAQRVGGGLKNFGKRQIHGATGAFDADQIGMAGNAAAAKKNQLLKLRMGDEMAHAKSLPGKQKIEQRFNEQMKGVAEQGQVDQDYRRAGLQNLPSLGKALWNKETRMPAIKAMGRSVAGSPGTAIMGVGLPLALSAPDIARGDESAQGGLTTGAKVRNLGINMATGTAFGQMPFLTQMGLGMGVDAASHRAFGGPSQVPVQGANPAQQRVPT